MKPNKEVNVNMPNQQELVRPLIEPLYRGKFWMQLIGVMLILSGILTALSIVGIIIAWIPIWAGWTLIQAAKATERAFNQGDELEMKFALGKLKTYFTIFGVLILIYILMMIIGLVMGASGMMGMMGNY
jgi:hypothetical protein